MHQSGEDGEIVDTIPVDKGSGEDILTMTLPGKTPAYQAA